MALDLVLTWERVPTLLASIAVLLLAAAINFHPSSGRVLRAFSLLLFLRGGLLALFSFTGPGATFDTTPVRVATYFSIAIPFAALYFLHSYQGWGRRGRMLQYAPAAYALCAAAIMFAFWAAREAFVAGPLVAVYPLESIAYGAIALVLGRRAEIEPSAVQRRSLRLVSLGFAWAVAYLATFQVLVSAPGLRQPTPWAVIEAAGWALALLLVLAAAVQAAVAPARRRGPSSARETRMFFFWALLPATLTGLWAAGVNLGSVPGDRFTIRVVLDAAWTLGFVLLVSFALLRYRLFDLDFKVRWTLEKGLLASLFAVVFFLLSEGIERLLSVDGTLPAILASGAITLALRPVHKLANRVARRLLPWARSSSEMAPTERAHLYRAMVEAAWADGDLTRAEERVLRVGRDRLGLPAPLAAQLEREAKAASFLPDRNPRREARRAAPNRDERPGTRPSSR